MKASISHAGQWLNIGMRCTYLHLYSAAGKKPFRSKGWPRRSVLTKLKLVLFSTTSNDSDDELSGRHRLFDGLHRPSDPVNFRRYAPNVFKCCRPTDNGA